MLARDAQSLSFGDVNGRAEIFHNNLIRRREGYG
jgi:hypothetical protein